MKNALLVFSFLFFSYTNTLAQAWNILGSGANGLNANSGVLSVAVDPSGNIYAGGEFSRLYNSDYVYYVAKWNGTSWNELGTETNALNANGFIYSIATDQSGNVYAAGQFGKNGHAYVAKWDGTSWTEVGAGSAHPLNANFDILSIVFDKNDNLYATGRFTDSNGNQYVAKWDGTDWTELGTGNSNKLNYNTYNTLAVDNSGNVYTTTGYSNIDDSDPEFYIIKWDGTSWSELGTGANSLHVNAPIEKIIVDATGNVYMAGTFTNANNSSYIAKWNGTSWSKLGGVNTPILNGFIDALAVDALGNLYAGGRFFNNVNLNSYVIKWNGTSWSELSGIGSGYTLGFFYSLVFDASGNLYAGGFFSNLHQNNFFVIECTANKIATAVKDPQHTVKFTVYPNPSTGNIYIADLPENIQLTVYNVLGEALITKQLYEGDSYTDLSNLSPGIYTLGFSGSDNSYTPVKWIKE